MVARTDAAHAGLARAMKSRAIEKEYLAVVYGRTPVQKGKVELGILRDPKDRKRMTSSRTEGRPSITLYEQLAAVCREFPRQALHARRLALKHPVTGEPMEFLAPVPPDIASLLDAAGLILPSVR
jgi:23S rRNA pseudouridine1911/1915/1917 synthase